MKSTASSSNVFQITSVKNVGETGVYAGCIEDQYDEKCDENVILSFDLFCKECGAVLGKWDNTNRKYFLGAKRKMVICHKEAIN
jgi:2-methylisocitrate lyase-like PEP mutase family enzyme